VTFQKYKYKPYDKSYPELFKKEKRKLKRILKKDYEIHHVGSTAVPGLGGKGIIDINICMPKKEFQKSIKLLGKYDYTYKPLPGDQIRKFIVRKIKYGGKERIVHVHLTWKNSHPQKSAASFRDYLIKNKKIRDEYAKIKRDASRISKEDGKKYRAYKNNFIEKTTKKALKKK